MKKECQRVGLQSKLYYFNHFKILKTRKYFSISTPVLKSGYSRVFLRDDKVGITPLNLKTIFVKKSSIPCILNHGDIIEYEFINIDRVDFKSLIFKNDFVCGTLSENKRFLKIHGFENKYIPIHTAAKIPTIDSPDAVFMARIRRIEDIKCAKLTYIGENEDQRTQERCLYINAGLGFAIDQVYDDTKTCADAIDSQNRLRVSPEMEGSITFCIDPIDAKDADDAISIKILGDDTFDVGIHIADITRFLKKKTALIEGAYRLGNTYYSHKSCLPMFSKELATHKFSFAQDKIRPSVSLILRVSNNIIKSTRIRFLNIKVDHAISYGYCERLINSDEPADLDRLASLGGPHISIEGWKGLKALYSISVSLKAFRMENFDYIDFLGLSPKTHKFLDKKDSDDYIFDESVADKSKSLVEEFMLFANHYVAQILAGSSNSYTLFRTNTFNLYKNDNARGAYKNDMGRLRGMYTGDNKEFADYLSLRRLNSSCYTYKHLNSSMEHFPLGFPIYLHFTSPIRRFPDVVAHFMLKHMLGSDAFPECISYNLGLVHFYVNDNGKNADNVYLRSIQVPLYKYLKNNNLMVNAIVFKRKYFVPSLNLTIFPVEPLYKDLELSYVEIQLIPVVKCGFLGVVGSLIKKHENIISREDKEWALTLYNQN